MNWSFLVKDIHNLTYTCKKPSMISRLLILKLKKVHFFEEKKLQSVLKSIKRDIHEERLMSKKMYRKKRLATTIASALMLSSPYVLAQEERVLEGGVIEEVVVTGSRIQRSNLTSTTPVNVVTAERIELSGAINTSELLESLPATGVATFSSTTSNFDTQNSGVNVVELRNLGEDRTLVLVNGRRFVGGIPGSQAVDFNSIPTEFIERIDVTTGGASAIYGSDALAGVVNVILKDSFDGFQVTGQTGKSDEGDDETYRLTMTGGFTFDENRGSAMMSATYDKENGVFARDRDNLGVDGFNEVAFGDSNDPQNAFLFDQARVPFLSSFSERGRFVIPDRKVTSGSSNLIVDDNGNVVPFVSSEHGFNRQAFRALSVPTERLLVSGVLNYSITDNLNWFMETNYSSTETNSSLEPFPFGSDDIYGGNQADCFDTNGDDVNDDCAFGIPALSPLVPLEMLQAAREANPGVSEEDLVIGFARRTTELGRRGADNLRQTFRVVTGFEGEFLDDFTYEFSLNYGRTSQEQKSSGQINVLNARYALDVITDPVSGEVICRDEIARLQGCLPFNVFGMGAITAGLTDDETVQTLRYLQANSSRSANIEQTVASGFIAGPLFSLPAGEAQFSIGVEYREESSESVADGLSQQGLNAGNISPPTIGSYDVTEFFAETTFPLLAGKPFVESLELDLAARFSDYSTVGNTSAYAAALRWSVVDDLLLRTQLSRAVRAPNVGELFEPLTESFQGGDDVCEGVTRDASGNAAFLNKRRDTDNPAAALSSGISAGITDEQQRVANACLQDPSIAARVDETGGLVLTQSEIQGVGGFNGGAAAAGIELTEETADTLTFGVVWDPSFADWAEPLNVTLDYFDIEIDDAISSLARQDSLDNCYISGTLDPSNDFCSNIFRFSSGPSVGALRGLNALSQNIAEIKTSGFDMQVGYDFDLGLYGSLEGSLTYTHLITYEELPFEGAEIIDSAGEVGFAEDKAILGWTYRYDNLVVGLTTEWIGESQLSNQLGNAYFGPSISDKFFHDIQVRYRVTDGIELSLGMDNITDEFVRIEQGGPGVPTGWNTRPDVYDALGARYYAGFKAKF